ncbi:hypothetical protein Tco_0510549 [Tanacetum coccineum]
MGPPVYPLAKQNPQPFYRPDYHFGYPQGKSKIFSGGYSEYYNSQWTLPPAWTESGVMLVLPADFDDSSVYSISEGEGDTHQCISVMVHDNKAKLAFVENLLGESEKLMWQQWAKHPGLSSGVLPAIKFTHTFVSEMCKDAALAKELRDLSLCSAYISGYYKNKQEEIWNEITVFMAIEEDDESDDHLEEEDNQFSHHTFMFHPGPPTKIAKMLRIEKERLEELRIEKKRLEEQKDEEIRELKAQLQKKEEEAEVQFSKEQLSTHWETLQVQGLA